MRRASETTIGEHMCARQRAADARPLDFSPPACRRIVGASGSESRSRAAFLSPAAGGSSCSTSRFVGAPTPRSGRNSAQRLRRLHERSPDPRASFAPLDFMRGAGARQSRVVIYSRSGVISNILAPRRGGLTIRATRLLPTRRRVTCSRRLDRERGWLARASSTILRRPGRYPGVMLAAA